MAEPTDDDTVGSIAEETRKLLLALGGGAGPRAADEHGGGAGPDEHGGGATCPHGWCPLCRLVELLRDDPELVERASSTAAGALRSLRDLLDQITPSEERRA